MYPFLHAPSHHRKTRRRVIGNERGKNVYRHDKDDNPSAAVYGENNGAVHTYALHSQKCSEKRGTKFDGERLIGRVPSFTAMVIFSLRVGRVGGMHSSIEFCSSACRRTVKPSQIRSLSFPLSILHSLMPHLASPPSPPSTTDVSSSFP